MYITRNGMYCCGMTENKQVPKVIRVAIKPELARAIDTHRLAEHRNFTNQVEVLLLEALAARDAAKASVYGSHK